MNIKELIGTRIKSLRQGKGLTQETLAEKIGISSKYLSSIERGKENPTLDTLIQLANALKVELFEIFLYAHEASNSEELKERIQSLIEKADVDRLRLATKLLRAVFH